MTYQQWHEEGNRRFGPEFANWKFVCPGCSNVAAVGEFEPFKDKGATPNSATCECIGRYTGGDWGKNTKPCNYAGYGLFRISPVKVLSPEGTPVNCFAFAEVTDAVL